jgi:hypothetical protein
MKRKKAKEVKAWAVVVGDTLKNCAGNLEIYQVKYVAKGCVLPENGERVARVTIKESK